MPIQHQKSINEADLTMKDMSVSQRLNVVQREIVSDQETCTPLGDFQEEYYSNSEQSGESLNVLDGDLITLEDFSQLIQFLSPSTDCQHEQHTEFLQVNPHKECRYEDFKSILDSQSTQQTDTHPGTLPNIELLLQLHEDDASSTSSQMESSDSSSSDILSPDISSAESSHAFDYGTDESVTDEEVINSNEFSIKTKECKSRRAELPQTQKKRRKRRGFQLWHFIIDMLYNQKFNPFYIKWIDRKEGIFKFVQPQEVAKHWGNRRNRKMCYEHMSRSLRNYYKKGIISRDSNRRLVYKFGPNADGWNRTENFED